MTAADLSGFAPVIEGIAATPPMNSRGIPCAGSNLFYRVILEPTAP